MTQETQIGVYFSANDAVYDWVIAFLNSFRTYNPALKLYLIPFNEDCERIVDLRNRYNFDLFIDESFERLEKIGQDFELGHTPTGPHWFRRYAAFWGPLDRFMYLDARQVVLADLEPLICALDTNGFDLLHYDCALDQVYEPGPFRQSLLRQGRGRGFNSGRWISCKGLFSLEEFEALAEGALSIREQLNPRNTDQAFINYCCDMKPVYYGHIAEVQENICQNAWSRQPGSIYTDDNQYYLWDYGGLDHKKQIIILHWAGQRLSAIMPRHNLFKRYYLQNQPLAKRVQFNFRQCFNRLFLRLFESIRRNRKVNIFYHYIKAN